MAQRNQRNRRGSGGYREYDYFGSRQAEQFDDSNYGDDFGSDYRGRPGSQMGDDGRMAGETYTYDDASERARSYGGREPRGYGGRGQDRGFAEEQRAYAPSRYDTRVGGRFESFTGNDQGGRDFVRGDRRPYGGYGRGFGGGYFDESRGADEYRPSSGSRYGYRGDYDDHDRGFFERAGDEIASWFGDDDAARRRQMDHRGSGPSNYTRSDERILEDACDSLTDDWRVDARNIQVTVKDGEVTLDGTVDHRDAKRCAEDCVEDISGVKHVQNNLRVQDRVGDSSDYAMRESQAGNT